MLVLCSWNAFAQVPFQLGNDVQNRKIVLFQAVNNDHQYFGLGINAGMLRYQVDNSNSSHAFFAAASTSTSNELMRITGTGNVGIGTTAPNAPLQFASTFADRKIVMFESGNNNHQYFGFGIGNQLQRYQVGTTTSSHAFFAGTSSTTSNELMRITGTGNVGIGTITPNAPLQFTNTTGNRKVVLFEVADNDHQYYGIGINNQIFRYQVDNTISSHAFYAATSTTDSTELMRITGTGKVGIGTTAPSEKLHVAGSVRIVDGTEGAGKILTSDANGRGTWTTPAAGGNTSELQKITEGSNTGWRILGRDAANHGDIGANALDLSRSTLASTTTGATGPDAFAAGFVTTASGTNSTAMGNSTNASGLFSTAMGSSSIASGPSSTAIGSSTTASGLSSTAIGSSTTASGQASTAMGISTRATQYASTAIGAGSRATGVVSTAIGNELRAQSATEVVVGSFNDTLTTFNATDYVGDNNRTFTVGTGSSNTARRTSFVVQQNGNVGIGASSPNAQLQLGNTVTNRKVVLFEVANNDHQYYGLGINNQVFRYQVDNTISSHAFYAATSTTASNELMRITGTGNVGIGTIAPSERLHVTGSVRIVDGTEGVGKVLISDANGKATWTTPAVASVSELQKITEGGNTGWRILGKDVANYGNIGSNAIDLSSSTTASTTGGATGEGSFSTGFGTTAAGQYSFATGFGAVAAGQYSFATGIGTTASNYASTATGHGSIASGLTSTAMGFQVKAKSFAEVAIGYWNDTLTSATGHIYIGDNNRVFTVGTGSPTARCSTKW